MFVLVDTNCTTCYAFNVFIAIYSNVLLVVYEYFILLSLSAMLMLCYNHDHVTDCYHFVDNQMRKKRCLVPPAHSDITTVPSLLTPSSSSCRYGVGVARVPFSCVDSFDTLLTNADTVEVTPFFLVCL